tara:strand:+ start:2972 stop:4360 length:1389 start_codon:yes stop_codon:yes gene_type:complete
VIRLLLFFIIGIQSSLASIGNSVGFGSRMTALGGSHASGGADGFAAYANPALLSQEKKNKWKLSYGWIYLYPLFKDISSVVTENGYASDKNTPVSSDVDTHYSPTFGQVIGLVGSPLPHLRNLSFGLTLYAPWTQILSIDSGETYLPEYVLDRASTQRPEVYFAVSLKILRGFHFGAGAYLGYGLTSKATVFLNDTTGEPSSMRFSSSAVPKLSPYAGILFESSQRKDQWGKWNLGAVFRAPLSSNSKIDLSSTAKVAGGPLGLDFQFQAQSALYYDPMKIEVGGNFYLSEVLQVFLQVEYQFWSQFESPTLNLTDTAISDCQAGGCPFEFSGSILPSLPVRNIWVPKVGWEWRTTDHWTLRAGYSYRPSIFKSLPLEAGNFLDPDRHNGLIGAGWKSKGFLGYALPWSLDFHLSAQALVTQTIVKTEGNESGDLSDQKIGAPGFQAGGWILGGGVSLSLEF